MTAWPSPSQTSVRRRNAFWLTACPLHACFVTRDAAGRLLSCCAGCETEAAAALVYLKGV